MAHRLERRGNLSGGRRWARAPRGENFTDGDADDVPEKISIDFDEAEESEKLCNSNGYRDSGEEWVPRPSAYATDGDAQKIAPDGGGNRGNGSNFSSHVGDQGPRPQRNRNQQRQQRQQNDRHQGGNHQSANGRSRRDDDRNSQGTGQQNNYSQGNSGGGHDQGNWRQQNNSQNRQKFARTVKIGQLSSGLVKGLECMCSFEKLSEFADANVNIELPPFDFSDAYENRTKLSMDDAFADSVPSANFDRSSHKILESLMARKFAERVPIVARGVLETIEGGDGLLVYAGDNYRIRPQSAFIPKFLIQRYGIRRGQDITAYLHPPTQNSTCPFVLRITGVMGVEPALVANFPKFKDLIPFYPTERLFLECSDDIKWDNVSMRIIDILTPIGLGQRGLIVAPPRTGKTVLLQGIANAISKNRPDVKLIILLIDERPEEVTDFRRQVMNAEIISSTFDESSDNHVHAADMVIDKARRQVEASKHVVILLDSITRLARAHNTEQPSSGKLLSGGVDANALQAPKKFFGAARNIEGGGSLTILATALVETGSRMDEVIFEEFKGTGNMELHLDRALVDKRVFPALSLEKSGTRKEELLYHPEEMEKVYTLRRAMKGVPPVDAMEMLIQRIRKTKTNTEFLLNVNR
ncbi:MAG: transcription termination factor Rho [Puniceicoccales bacterium]|nr:transcription termination factor Rho [Puniceicoccales bacterium]